MKYMPSKISKRLENIDYLRGIAIIFVVFYYVSLSASIYILNVGFATC